MFELKLLNLDDLKLDKSGALGFVYTTLFPGTYGDKPVVLKFQNAISHLKDGVNVLKEAEILIRLDHENINKIFGILVSPENGIVLSRLSCTLKDMIQSSEWKAFHLQIPHIAR